MAVTTCIWLSTRLFNQMLSVYLALNHKLLDKKVDNDYVCLSVSRIQYKSKSRWKETKCALKDFDNL